MDLCYHCEYIFVFQWRNLNLFDLSWDSLSFSSSSSSFKSLAECQKSAKVLLRWMLMMKLGCLPLKGEDEKSEVLEGGQTSFKYPFG